MTAYGYDPEGNETHWLNDSFDDLTDDTFDVDDYDGFDSDYLDGDDEGWYLHPWNHVHDFDDEDLSDNEED